MAHGLADDFDANYTICLARINTRPAIAAMDANCSASKPSGTKASGATRTNAARSNITPFRQKVKAGLAVFFFATCHQTAEPSSTLGPACATGLATPAGARSAESAAEGCCPPPGRACVDFCGPGGPGPSSASGPSRTIAGARRPAGLAAFVNYLITPVEPPPRFGLDHEFAVDSEEFLDTMAGATGVPFMRGQPARDAQQRRRVLSGDARGDRQARAVDHDRGLHLLGG